MEPLALVLFVAGLVLLLAGAEFLVRGAARLASALGVSSLVIGLTVVAWGTGSPELAVAVKAAMVGQPDLTIGNVVGSNIANVLLILGLASLMAPLTVAQRLVRLEVPLVIGASVLTLLISLDGNISTPDGLLFLVCITAYTIWSIQASRQERRAVRAEYEREFGAAPEDPSWEFLLIQVAFVAGGLGLLVVGSNWLVEGASAIARALGLSDLLIGLTIVALGTSLPEVATSMVAAWKGERDIAVGNAIGSNLFNLLAVLGVTATIAPGGLDVSSAALNFDIPVMIAVAVACLPVFFRYNKMDRWDGSLFLSYYVAYVVYLVLDATRREMAEGFNWIMVVFVLPITALTLLLLAIDEVRRRRTGG